MSAMAMICVVFRLVMETMVGLCRQFNYNPLSKEQCNIATTPIIREPTHIYIYIYITLCWGSVVIN